MKIVVDTNVVISGIFFGGNPRRIVEQIVDGNIDAYATPEIVDAKALYIVSGDNDLLDIREYKEIKIITAKEFCNIYL